MENKQFSCKQVRNLVRVVFFLCFAIGLCVYADPVDSKKAEQVVKGWLNQNRKPLNTELSNQITSVDAFSDSQGQIEYYVTNLSPKGFVIVSADDALEPIIAFSPNGSFNASLETPLGLLIYKDTKSRKDALQKQNSKKKSTGRTVTQKKWDVLTAKANQSYAISYGLSGITDVRVAPLVQSKWGQQDDGLGNYCYDYYTPNHYPSGCVATAMAQLIRYHEYPVVGIGLHTETVIVDGQEVQRTTRGGNGSGGAYNYANMPYDPFEGSTATQRAAIGSLCYDAGVAVGMDYAVDGSGSYLYYPYYDTDADRAMVSIFQYGNCIAGNNDGDNLGSVLVEMMNPNLDAGLPVILGIYDSAYPATSGHAILADGYGYNNQTLYHHLNMGWYGMDDVWYTLPDIQANQTGYTSDVVDDCLYNIFTNGNGEIISGRVLDSASLPLEGITVRAKQVDIIIAEDVTDSRGIYALVNLSSNQTCLIELEKNGLILDSREAAVGFSEDGTADTGNLWAFDFDDINPATPPTASDIDLEISDANGITIELLAIDDGLPNPPGEMQYIITSLPEHGWLYEPDSEDPISAVPYVLLDDLNTVIYKPCPYYMTGEDSFEYAADDGGQAPNGGVSEVGTVLIQIDMTIENTFDPTTSYYYLPLFTQFRKARTQVIYYPEDLGAREMLIQSIALDVKTLPNPSTLNHWTIQMKHTADNVFATTDFDVTDLNLVYDANEIFTQTDWTVFNFAIPFRYNGTDNLLIDFSFNNLAQGQNGSVYCLLDNQNLRMAYNYSNDPDADPLQLTTALNRLRYAPHLKVIGTYGISDVLFSDFNFDCRVELQDLLVMTDAWMTEAGDAEYNGMCDISWVKDQKINLADYAVLASEWLNWMGEAPEWIYSVADFNRDLNVDAADLQDITAAWLTGTGNPEYNPKCDISVIKDEYIDLSDYTIFASEWMNHL